MNQRVNIQYSIDMEELDLELERLLTRSRQCLNDTNKELNNLTGYAKGDKILSSDTANKISEIRENMARVDFTLSDISRLIGSYVTYQLGQEESEAEEEYDETPQQATQPAPTPVPNPYASDIYPPNFQTGDPNQLEAAANQLHETIKNGAIPLPPDIDPEVLAEKLEEFKRSIKNAQ